MERQYPAIVRILGRHARRNEAVHIGSGSIIGSVDDRALMVATAAHNFLGLDHALGLPHLPEMPDDTGGCSREALTRILVGVVCPNEERMLRILTAERAVHFRNRDTALLFIEQPPGMKVGDQIGKSPLYLGHPPAHNEAILIGGFKWHKPTGLLRLTGSDEQTPAPPRDLVVREGFAWDFGQEPTSLLRYPTWRHGIPVASGMSGGPVMQIVPDGRGGAFWCLVALNNTSADHDDANPPENVEVESHATSVITLWSHEVPLIPEAPVDENNIRWVPFAEAIRRGMVYTYGPEVHRVIDVTLPDGTKRRQLSSLYL